MGLAEIAAGASECWCAAGRVTRTQREGGSGFGLCHAGGEPCGSGVPMEPKYCTSAAERFNIIFSAARIRTSNGRQTDQPVSASKVTGTGGTRRRRWPTSATFCSTANLPAPTLLRQTSDLRLAVTPHPRRVGVVLMRFMNRSSTKPLREKISSLERCSKPAHRKPSSLRVPYGVVRREPSLALWAESRKKAGTSVPRSTYPDALR